MNSYSVKYQYVDFWDVQTLNLSQLSDSEQQGFSDFRNSFAHWGYDTAWIG